MTPPCDPATGAPRNPAAPQARPLPELGTAPGPSWIPFEPRARRAYSWFPSLTRPGRIYVGPTGETLRANLDGSVDELNGVPARRSIASDPCARRAP